MLLVLCIYNLDLLKTRKKIIYSLLNPTKDVKRVVTKIYKILDDVFVVKNAFEKSLRDIACPHLRYVTRKRVHVAIYLACI